MSEEIEMNVMKNLKGIKVSAFLALAFSGLLLTGCSEGEIMPVDGNWDKEASAYFNANMPALKNLPGKVYDYQNIRKNNASSRQIVWIDGVKVLDVHGNSNLRVPGTNRTVTAYQGVRVRWSQEDGYMVDTGRVGLKETVKMLQGNHRDYWHAFL
jgi:hypothetical protein